MIQKIGLVNSSGDRLMLELRKPESSGLVIKEIDGLGSLEADVSTTPMSVGDGTYATRSRVEARSITVTLIYIFKPGVSHTIEDTREMLYNYVIPGEELDIQVLSDNREMYIQGFVEDIDTDMFQKSTTTSFSVLCPDPYFYDISETAVSIPSWNSTGSTTTVFVPNGGDVECGVRIEFTNFTSASGKIKLYATSLVNVSSTVHMYGFAFVFDVSDWYDFNYISNTKKFIYSSVIGSRGLTVSGDSALYLLKEDDFGLKGKWYQLPVGGSELGIYTTANETATATLYYRKKYVGV